MLLFLTIINFLINVSYVIKKVFFIKKLVVYSDNETNDFVLLEKKYKGDVGYDILYKGKEDIKIEKMDSILIDTKMKFKINGFNRYYAQISNRSSFSLKKIIVLGGVIDEGYNGNIKVVLFNLNKEDVIIKKNDKIAQIIFLKYDNVKISYGCGTIKKNYGENERNDKGFGSTDIVDKNL